MSETTLEEAIAEVNYLSLKLAEMALIPPFSGDNKSVMALAKAVRWLRNIVNPIEEGERKRWEKDFMEDELEIILDDTYRHQRLRIRELLTEIATDEDIRDDLKELDEAFNNLEEDTDNADNK